MEGDLAATRLEAARAEARLEEAHEEIRALQEREERLVMERCVFVVCGGGWGGVVLVGDGWSCWACGIRLGVYP